MNVYKNPIDMPIYIQDNTMPQMAYKQGEDINKWRMKAKEKFMELIGLNNFIHVDDPRFCIEETKENESYIRHRFSFLAEEKCSVVGYLLIPTAVENPSVMVCLQGHTSGMHISLGLSKFEGDDASIQGGRDYAIQAIEHGYAAIVIEQRNFGERKSNPEERGTDCYRATMYEIMLGRTTIAGRIWDVMKTIDIITESFPQLNKDDINIMGNSSGGNAAYYTACLDDRIKACMPSCSICTYKHSIATLYHCSCNHIPSILRYFEMADLALLIAPRPMVIVAGRDDDENFPLKHVKEAYAEIERLYGLADAKDKLRFVVGQGGHTFYPKEGWRAFLDITKSM